MLPLRDSKKINIVQWNGRSVRAKQQHLKNYLYENSIHIAILSETWFKKSDKIHFQGYYIERLDRDDDHGGVAILISKTLSYTPISFNEIMFSRGIEVCGVHLDNLNLNIISLYRPSSVRTTRTDWHKLFSRFTNRTLIAGDFNAAHTMWGSPCDDSLGKILVEILESQNFVVLNDGSPTRIKLPKQKNDSAVDLSLVTSDYADKFSWSTTEDVLGSDHFLIKLSINETWTPQTIVPSTKWKEEKADWTLYQTLVADELARLPTPENNTHRATYLCDSIATAASNAMPEKKPFAPKKSSPIWWDNDCKRIDEQRRLALRQYKRESNFENYCEYKNADALAKKMFKQKSRQSWQGFVSNLNKNSSPTAIWNTMKKLDNKNFQPTPNIITPEVIDKVMDYMSPPFAPNDPSSLGNNANHNKTTSTCKVGFPFVDASFNIEELECALSVKRKSSPGFDFITYSMLNKLPLVAKNTLLSVYNQCWISGEILPIFRKIIVILFLKHGKERSMPSSYRPISLLSCVTKSYERMIKLRLEWCLEHYDILPVTQYGFRKGLGTIDAVSHLVTDIQCTFSKNKYLTCLFVDLKGAYDCIDLNILEKKICDVNFSRRAAANIVGLYKDREIYVRDQLGRLHGPRLVNQGLPQGSVLSPLLFNIYTRDLHMMWDDSVTCIQYADDLCFYSIQDTYEKSVNALKYIMYCLKRWADENNFSLSPEKSAAMFFTRHRTQQVDNLKLAGIEVPVVKKYKYLGMVLDNKLLWSQHILHIKKKCDRGINMLKFVSKRRYGATPQVALTFYKAYIRSIIDYGCVLYGGASTSNLLMLDRLQLRALRICIGAMGSSPSYAVLSEAHEPNLETRRMHLACKFLVKMEVLVKHDYMNKICQLTTQCLTNKYWQKKRNPPLVDAFLEMKDESFVFKKYCYFENEYRVFISVPPVVFPDFSDSQVYNIQLARSILSDFDKDLHIYTDGSKSSEGVASAYCIPSIEYFQGIKLNNECSIYTAEAYAIVSALQWALDFDASNVVIISDSKSVLSAVCGSDCTNPIIANIKNKVVCLKERGLRATFIWVKGHSGITGNEMVDQVAKSATSSDKPSVNIYTPSDMISKFRNKALVKWSSVYSDYAITSKNPYFLLHTAPAPRLSYLDCARNLACTITRLKINHGRFPAHLSKIGLRNSACCPCDNFSVGDTNHMIFACPLNNLLRGELFTILQRNFQLPLNLTTLLSSNDVNTLMALSSFMLRSGIFI